MPSHRQIRAIALVALLLFLAVYYVSNGAKSTYESPFYKNTVAAMEKKKTAAERDRLISQEKDRAARVERLRKEHDGALEDLSSSSSTAAADATGPDGPAVGPHKQKPIADEAAPEKSVAGRKKMGPASDKIVQKKPDSDKDDGVARVGNIAKATAGVAGDVSAEEKERERQVERGLNAILKKGPIIIFSKSYCPFSMKAKHILLDVYSINPPPYVVELDRHELGPGLQQSLARSTGRRTVPNVLINGKSIGGGDDIEALHHSHTLIDKVTSMGGKRIMSITENGKPKMQARSAQAEPRSMA